MLLDNNWLFNVLLDIHIVYWIPFHTFLPSMILIPRCGKVILLPSMVYIPFCMYLCLDDVIAGMAVACSNSLAV